MVQRIANIIKDYQDRVRELPFVPTTSFRRHSLGYPGDANKLLLPFLFCERNIGIQFLKYVGLIHSKVQCNSCGRDMTCYATIECTWCHVKAFLGLYHRQKDYELHLAHYMFAARGVVSFHSIPCHRRIHRLVLLHTTCHILVRRHVTYSCSSPGSGRISQLRYARAINCLYSTDAMFSP